MYTKKQRIIALAALLAVVFVTYFSMLFIVNEQNHHCVGENCPICAALEKAESTLKTLHSFTLSACVTVFAVSIFFMPVLNGIFSDISYSSLVTQKVRMDN